MDRRLLDLLVCPLCKGPLQRRDAPDELVCPADRLAFPIRDGIAVMLESAARPLGDAGDSGPALPPPPAATDLPA